MLDHVFTQLVSSHRHAFEAALLQRQAVEERFQVDVFLGDVSFETSYSLPGEERPARIRVDTSLDWPTWSQTAYRSWAIGEEPDELPEVLVEIAFRVQGLVEVPEVDPLLGVLPADLDVLGDQPLVRGAATIEQVIGSGSEQPECAMEVSYEGSCQLDETVLDDPTSLADAAGALGRAVASVLVRIGDLPFIPSSEPRSTSPAEPDRSQSNRPASTASARRSAWGRAPTWEMTSAAHTPPRRADSSGARPLVSP